jgi:hypothetical protein
VTRIDANTWTFVADDTANHCLTHGFIDDLDCSPEPLGCNRIAFPFAMTLRRM